MNTLINNFNGDYSAHGVMSVNHIEVFQDDGEYMVYVIDNNSEVVQCLLLNVEDDGNIVECVRQKASDFNCEIEWYTDLEVQQIVQNINQNLN
jgi:hypothetical protein